jgi:hypothetical protein
MERVRKYLALLAFLASLQDSSGNVSAFKIAQGCQVAALERARFVMMRQQITRVLSAGC